MSWFDIMEDMRKMQEEIERAFPEFWRRTPLLIPGESKEGGVIKYRRPLTDLKETENEYIMELEMPGITKDDIDIKVTEDSIEIKAEKKFESKEEDPKRGISSKKGDIKVSTDLSHCLLGLSLKKQKQSLIMVF